MIQPTLTSYNLETEDPQAVLLDAKSRQEDVILLLDTFFYVVKWAGKLVAEWRDDNLREDPEYAYIGDFLDKAEVSFLCLFVYLLSLGFFSMFQKKKRVKTFLVAAVFVCFILIFAYIYFSLKE